MSIRHIKAINKTTKIDIIIPAAGMGKRMRSYGPKSLIRIKNTTVLENQLKIIKRVMPDSNVILVTGFQAEQLMNSSPDTLMKIENTGYETNNVVRSIGLGLRVCQNDVMVLYGDLVFNEYFLSSLDLNNSSVFVGEEIMNDSEIGCIVNKHNRLENMMYDLKNKWGQLAFFKGKELRLLKEICWNPVNYNLFGFEAINKIISNGGSFVCSSNKKAMVIDIDSSKDLELAGEII